ncbi:glycosyltransferase family 4 protein [Salinicoccus bachuensis]|uniref:Glycosyltransferase family 4 protein n=1 Tax=Salinicoccus bachuensis TaxID=3136731 RepID=A0ABZ3CLA7_9STAP
MNLLYLIHFNSPQGGLHENVYATAKYMKSQGDDVWVVLKEGQLQKRFNDIGIHTVSTDYNDLEKTVEDIEALGIEFDAVHMHPGPSRKVGIKYSQRHQVPAFATFHGMWYDSLKRYADGLNGIITVSEGVKTFLQTKIQTHKEKFYVFPNGYNDQVFKPRKKILGLGKKKLKVGLVTRLDQDKQFIIDIFRIGLQHIVDTFEQEVEFMIVGDGTLKGEVLEDFKEIIDKSPGGHKLNFLGWKEDKELNKAYNSCDIVVAPGRCVIEAMACGKPVIAVGSKRFIGLIDGESWQYGVYNNFGGYGRKFEDYTDGSIEKDLDFLAYEENRKQVGEFSQMIANEFYKEEDINQRLRMLYSMVILGRTT